jgi:midasin (ATPase involved in ribosome maturation)
VILLAESVLIMEPLHIKHMAYAEARLALCRAEWAQFADAVAVAQRVAKVAEGGFAFAFREGALLRALRNGDWILLDEINLAPSEVLS